jgi:hypothetical protein
VVSTVAPIPQGESHYRITSPDGTEIKIPKELFGVLWDFLHGEKPSGTVIIQFRNGGVAGLESLTKRTYK